MAPGTVSSESTPAAPRQPVTGLEHWLDGKRGVSGLDCVALIPHSRAITITLHAHTLAHAHTHTHTHTFLRSFDPRTRAWYVAASSGPKDVVVIIDKSGSMLDNNRLEIAKEVRRWKFWRCCLCLWLIWGGARPERSPFACVPIVCLVAPLI